MSKSAAKAQAAQPFPPFPDIEGVEFRHIPDWPGYAVSDDGKIWSCRPKHGRGGWVVWREFFSSPNKDDGYIRVTLSRDGKSQQHSAHILILNTFIGPAPSGQVARHANLDRADNRLSNLAWGPIAGFGVGKKLKVKTHGKSKTPEFKTWLSIRSRCKYPYLDSYKYYGGRGIKVCERWERSFANFIADMGPKPSPRHSLDRIDGNGNYCKENCRWATHEEQCNNKKSNVMVEIDGESKTVSQWCRHYGIERWAVQNRINKLRCSHTEAITLAVAAKQNARQK